MPQHAIHPLVSIITVVKNNVDTIEEAILSIINQTYSNVQYIVIDGGSTDGTLDILNKYYKLNNINILVSEQDYGIADAWNKGIKLSSGSIIGLLNSDDVYHHDNILNAVNKFKEINFSDVVLYGTAIFVDKFNKPVSTNNRLYNKSRLDYGFGFMHTSCFCTKNLYNKIGLFNESARIAVDTEFLLRCVKANIQFLHCNITTRMRKGGISDKHPIKAHFEYLKFTRIIGFGSARIYFNILIFIIYILLKKTLGLSNLKFIRLQYIYFHIHMINLISNYIPFHFFKKKFLSINKIYLGDKSYIHSGVKFFGTENVYIGNNSTVNFDCFLDNRFPIYIGDNVSIAHNSKIYTMGHDIDDPLFSHKGASVHIDDYVCIFSNSIVMPGIKIGKGAVILPGSIVVKDVDEYTVVGGNPASFIKNRNPNLSYKLNYGYWFAI